MLLNALLKKVSMAMKEVILVVNMKEVDLGLKIPATLNFTVMDFF